MQPQREQRATEPELVLACASNIILPAKHLAPVLNGQRPPLAPPELNRKLAARKITARPGTPWLALLSVFSIPLVGFADYATGPEISFVLLYILPVATAAWFGGRRLGLIAAFASAATWFTAGIPEGAQLSRPLFHCWNATSQLLVYSLLAFLFSSIRQQLDELELVVQQKTALLEQEIAERARVEREVIDICAREQRRIAYDLHDNLGQHLVGIAFRAKALEEKLRPVWPGEAEEMSEIVHLTNEAAKQTRLTARNLDGADGVGDLNTALQRLAADVRHNCQVNGWVKTDSHSLPVSTPVAVQLYRIAQEAVHNAVEHGDAKEVQIDLACDDREIVLKVRDNGRGFDGSAAGQGMGLRIMRYRAQCVGGSCEVQSTRAGGTTVTCRVLLPSGSRVN
jgi:signal transduction histidine kinase